MEIKVQCDCGQKFKFDVEPVNGQVPFAVKCPVCGFDATPRANVILQQVLASAPPPPASAPAPLSIAAAAPALAPAYTPPPAPAPMRPAGLSINRTPPPPQAAPAAELDEDIEGKESEDSADGDDDTGDTKLGWTMWCWIILFILLIIGGSYLKSARKSLVNDVLDWGWNKVTGASSGTVDDGKTDYKALDKEIEEEIKGDDAAEARAWLAVPANAIFEGDRAEVVALMENFYKAGCVKVYITGIEKLGGANVSASMVAVLPTDPGKRQAAFAVEKEFSEKHGMNGDPDQGQQYISLTFD